MLSLFASIADLPLCARDAGFCSYPYGLGAVLIRATFNYYPSRDGR